MIRHLAKLVWHRKRAGALLVLEIFCAFLVLFGVSTLVLYLATNQRRPLGFSWQDVWMVEVGNPEQTGEAPTAEEEATTERLLRETATLPEVEAAGAMDIEPYSIGASRSGFTRHGKPMETDEAEVTPGVKEVLRLDLVAGRWFTAADLASPYRPVVINRTLARAAFGDENPLGQELEPGDAESHTPGSRVIGVVSEFRTGGELSAAGNQQLRLHQATLPSARRLRRLVVRTRPGTPADFEPRLADRLRGVARDWTFTVQPLSRHRDAAFRRVLAPLTAALIVAFFLLAMVGLGLVGVLWQNVLRRTREIGLRRAAGASRASIHGQLLMEQLLLTTLGVLVGVALVLQLPLLGVTGWLGPGVFAGGVGIALAAIYLLAAVSALYPSLLAGRVQPAEALRYE
jgi:putative ABC transport system permease protein